MAFIKLPSIDTLEMLLRCDPQTGKLFWLERTPDMFLNGKVKAEHNCARWNALYAGKEAFTSVGSHGYLCGMVNHKTYRAHRIIYKMATGTEPEEVDHINGDVTDNRIVNLRSVDHAENAKNRRVSHNNTSGVIGVCWDKRENKWLARINIKGKRKHLGYYSDFEEAVRIRKASEKQYEFHRNHGTTHQPS